MTPGLSLLNLSAVVDKESSLNIGSSLSPESTTSINNSAKDFSQLIKQVSNAASLVGSTVSETTPEPSIQIGTSGYFKEVQPHQEIVSLLGQQAAVPQEPIPWAMGWGRPVPLEPTFIDEVADEITNFLAQSDSLEYPSVTVSESSKTTIDFPAAINGESTIKLNADQTSLQEPTTLYDSTPVAMAGPVRIAPTPELVLSANPTQLGLVEDLTQAPVSLANKRDLFSYEDSNNSDQAVSAENLLANMEPFISDSDYSIEDLPQGLTNSIEVAVQPSPIGDTQSTAVGLEFTFESLSTVSDLDGSSIETELTFDVSSADHNLVNGFNSTSELALTSLDESAWSRLTQLYESDSSGFRSLTITESELDSLEDQLGPTDAESHPSAILHGNPLLQEMANRELRTFTSTQNSSPSASLNSLWHGSPMDSEIASPSVAAQSQLSGSQMNVDSQVKSLPGTARENSVDMSITEEFGVIDELFNADERLEDFDKDLEGFVNNNALKLLQASSSSHALSSPSTPTSFELRAGLNTLAQLSVPQSVHTASWGSEVSDKVMWMASQGISEAEIQLDPPELGPLQARVTVHQDQAQVVFTSQSSQVRDALDQQATRLREMFAGEGLNLTDVDVSDQQTQDRQERDQADGGQGSAHYNESEPVTSQQVVSSATSQFLVDQYV